METKEEILKKHFDKKGITNEHIHVAAYLSVLDAMNEYATQQVNLLNKPAVINNEVAACEPKGRSRKGWPYFGTDYSDDEIRG